MQSTVALSSHRASPSQMADALPDVVVRRQILWPAWLAVVLLILVFAFQPVLPLWLQYLPFALSMIFVGLPHGAVDHLVPFRMLGARLSAWPLLGFIVLYLAASALYLLLWFTAPVVGFVCFILMTWFHWGQSDLYALRTFIDPAQAFSRAQRLATLVVRGGLPMLVPLFAFPDIYEISAFNIIRLFNTGSAEALDWAFATPFRLALGLAFGALIIAKFIVDAQQGGITRGWWLDVGETALLLVYFAVVPPLVAIGIYFCLWHSLRHILRLNLIDPVARDALQQRRPLLAWSRFARDAFPLTMASLAFLGVLYFFVPQAPASIGEGIGLYLALIAALTFPHVLLTIWMDRREGVWIGQLPREISHTY